MSSNNKFINNHIKKYLNYYCKLQHPPRFAVLLKGNWGCGKTWFINQYCKELKQNKYKYLYVSLYGMTRFSDIENSFYRQLHPLLSSEGMVLAGKIFQGLVKTTFKIDINRDGTDDGNVSLQIPKIDIPESFKKADESILIFDDLERCQIEIGNLLGYINYFVEHNGFKVILIANEEKLLEKENYNNIREKLIGKTFQVNIDFEGALDTFIKETNNLDVKSFLKDNKELLKSIYKQSNYNNLRSLKQIILDFERIYHELPLLPKESNNKLKLLQEILKILTAFSIEIKRATIVTDDINILDKKYKDEIEYQARKENHKNQDSLEQSPIKFSDAQEKSHILSSVLEIVEIYKIFDLYLYDPFLTLSWWHSFFDRGIIDVEQLKEIIKSSIYFHSENTPNWIKLWHFSDLSDNEFPNVLETVISEYVNRKFINISEIKQVTGILLKLSEEGLYTSKSKQEILQEAKLYIDELIDNGNLNLHPGSLTTLHEIRNMYGYKGLGLQGVKLEEFKEFISYFEIARQSAIEKRYPNLVLELLEIMQNEPCKFYQMICVNDMPNTIDDSHQIYCDIPIFKYIEPSVFLDRLLSIDFLGQGTCLYALKNRYQNQIKNNFKLREEINWLKELQNLLSKEIEIRKGTPSGYRLNRLNRKYLIEATESDKNIEE